MEELRLENARLTEQIRLLQKDLDAYKINTTVQEGKVEHVSLASEDGHCRIGQYCNLGAPCLDHELNADMVHRYSRQLLVPAFGVRGQEKLLKSSVLVIGAGGLGSPVALYLSAAGVGCLGLVDHDAVELNNLHRQVIHQEAFIGEPKVKSASAACRAINSCTRIVEYDTCFHASNAIDIVAKYDVVVDATDNVPTRYLINDACVAMGKPLVSGAALGTDGQLTVYNFRSGPCYRCLFPEPPPSDACQRCSDSGVLGVVPGIIGSLQALEAIKLASEVGEPLSQRLLIFDALSTAIHIVKLRGKNPACLACGMESKISKENLSQIDYEAFTGSSLSDKAPPTKQIVSPSHQISCFDLKREISSGGIYILLDVREEHQYKIVSLPNSINIAFSRLEQQIETVENLIETKFTSAKEGGSTVEREQIPIYVMCRRGNDSQRAVEVLRDKGFAMAFDVKGGLESWAKEVDSQFPLY